MPTDDRSYRTLAGPGHTRRTHDATYLTTCPSAYCWADTEQHNAGGEAALTTEERWTAQALTRAKPGAADFGRLAQRKNPNRERLGFRHQWRRGELNPGPR
jgi:hypothetical protein